MMMMKKKILSLCLIKNVSLTIPHFNAAVQDLTFSVRFTNETFSKREMAFLVPKENSKLVVVFV